ncbi:stalk domain-containing protein [Paenibacillus lutrae]|nr:stalk domain-containing protein [Paenibacillus lutrae]
MSKLLKFLCLIAIFMVSVPLESHAANSSYQLFVNDKKFEGQYQPIVRNNAIYVPMWGVLSELGISPEWDEKYRTFRVNTSSGVVFFKTNSPMIIRTELNVNNFDGGDTSQSSDKRFGREVLRLNYYPIAVNDVVYVPLVFMTNYLNLNVVWGENNDIQISGGNFSVEQNLKNLYKAWNDKFGKTGNSYSNYWYAYNYEGFRSKYFNTAFMYFPQQLANYSELAEYFNQDLWVYKPSDLFTDVGLPNLTKVKITYIGDGAILVNDGNYDYTVPISPLAEDSISGFLTDNPYKAYNWTQKAWDAIRAEKIMIGMNQDMVVMSWGYPKRTNSYEGLYGTYSQWVYDSDTYVYFEDGILSSIQY